MLCSLPGFLLLLVLLRSFSDCCLGCGHGIPSLVPYFLCFFFLFIFVTCNIQAVSQRSRCKHQWSLSTVVYYPRQKMRTVDTLVPQLTRCNSNSPLPCTPHFCFSFPPKIVKQVPETMGVRQQDPQARAQTTRAQARQEHDDSHRPQATPQPQPTESPSSNLHKPTHLPTCTRISTSPICSLQAPATGLKLRSLRLRR